MSSEKPFPPSLKRLEKLRAEGNIVRSRMVTYALGWGVAGSIASVFISLEFPRELIHCVENGSELSGIQHCIGLGVRLSVFAMAFTVGVPGLLNVFTELFLGGWSVAPRALRFAPERIGFVSGFKRFGRAIRTSPGTCARYAVAIGSIGFLLFEIASDLPELVVRDERAVMLAVSRWGGIAWGVFLILLCLCAACEYFAAKRRYLRDNGMTFEELRQEQKEEEGDPHVRAERRSIHEWLARGDLTERVRRSKVILIGHRRRNGNESAR